MTRAAKLAVTLWSVMVLSGCASTRFHDKPDSLPRTPSTSYQNKKRNRLVDKTAADYVRGRDSLKTALQKEALAVLNEPMKFAPVAASSLSFEKYKLDSMKTKKLNPNDSALYTQRGRIFTDGPYTYVYPLVDCDEILHDAGDADYVSYKDPKRGDRLIAVKDLRELRASAAEFSDGAPADTKLYISFEPYANAFYFGQKEIEAYALDPNKKHVMVTALYLQTHDCPMVKSTLRHEWTHDETWNALVTNLNDMAATGNIDIPLVMQFNRYMEYGSDSLAFAKENKNGMLSKVRPADLPAVRRYKYDYQRARSNIVYNILDMSGRNFPVMNIDDMNAYNESKNYIAATTSFDDSSNTRRTHPSHAQRIYYTIIHQRRAKELQENGKTVLYEQYGDLLPKKPEIPLPKPARQNVEAKPF